MSVLVNGSPTAQFSVEKGFNIVVEGLSRLLRKTTVLGWVSGASFGGNRVHITHLQFADDTIIFLKPKLEYFLYTRRILRCFELASGLCINFHKSCVVKIGRLEEFLCAWTAVFKCQHASLRISYLGLPLGGRPNVVAF
ncbi:hypothetical protein Dsin_010195 [Dipteronia sinensis]|uniref:Reverse transcriptase domain-containing protein n=1 Tax=Dipteronia sinensis TaxID=43782 RepID=A0AAE0ASZ8_9ROSI|nr:hypothetical protein Dsin_010195 [Dipteronia sinensis]